MLLQAVILTDTTWFSLNADFQESLQAPNLCENEYRTYYAFRVGIIAKHRSTEQFSCSIAADDVPGCGSSVSSLSLALNLDIKSSCGCIGIIMVTDYKLIYNYAIVIYNTRYIVAL